MPRPVCKVCQSGAAAIVDSLLQQGKFLRDIASQVGLSKSAVHRHSLKCYVRAAAANLKTKKFNPATDRTLVKFDPDADAYHVHHVPQGLAEHGQTITAAEIRPRDCILVVKFEKSKIPGSGSSF